MIERQSRTIICGVLFLDIVEYSRKPVSEQMKLRDRLNTLLSRSLEGVAPNDRIILDTGDGAAVTFLGDPEDGLFTALALRQSLADAPGAGGELRLRCGINLGPVKLVKDLNRRPNIIGDGINVARRIMGFAQPGQILVSRSYYEVVSRLADGYTGLFEYEGSRTDKHVREHEVYAVSSGKIPVRSGRTSPSAGLPPGARGAAALKWLANLPMQLAEAIQSRPKLGTAVAVVAILAAGTGVRLARDEGTVAAVAGAPGAEASKPAQPERAENAPGAAAPTASPAQPPAAPVAAAGPEVMKPAPMAAPAEGSPKSERHKAPHARKAAELKPGPEGNTENVPQVAATRQRSAGNAPQAAAARQRSADSVPQGTVSVSVLPWGEVYVDGKPSGVSPPVHNIQIAPGPHEIEFRNTTFPRYVAKIDVKPGARITVRHKFEEATGK